MKIETNHQVLRFDQGFWDINSEVAPEPIQEVTAKELREAAQDYLLTFLQESARVRHFEDPMGRLEGTKEFDDEVAKQANRIMKLFGYSV